jgi:hypothetical protein
MALPGYSQPEQETPTTFPRTDWQGLFFDSADSGKLKRIDDAGTVVSIEDISGPVGLDEGGTGADLSSGQGVLVQATSGANVSSLGGTGFLKLASGAPSVAALLRSEMPAGALFTDAAISGTLQAVEDAAGNVSGLKIGTGDIEVQGVTVGRGTGGDYTNAAVGYQALYGNTTGYRNAAVGYQALVNNTTGYHNLALGYQALVNNTTGYRNSALGYQVLYGNSSGHSNLALGYAALLYNTTGYYNTALGNEAGRYAGTGTSSNETSNNCIYIGYLTRAGADGRNRENVIGQNLAGNGNNTTTIGETIVFPDMPTASAGLPAGALWNDSGTVKIV